MRWILLLVACAAHDGGSLASCTASPAPSTGGAITRDAVTIQITPINGSMRFSVPIRIGDSAPLDAFLDTGSSGLRILAGAVPDSAFTCATAAKVSYSYHSGLLLDGVAAWASVTIGESVTPSPIPVMLVQSIGCTPAMPSCNAQGKTAEQYSFFGPYKAILGIGMRNGAGAQGIGNPIAQLAGQPPFVVEAPAYGGTSGTLVIGPPDNELARFKRYQLPAYDGAPLANGIPTWDDRFGLPACVNDQTAGIDYCVPAELDSGNPPVYIEWPPQISGNRILPSGSQIAITVGPAADPLGEYSFTVGSVATPGSDEIEIEPATGNGFMNLGTSLFFHFNALFDQANGIVGLASQ